MPPKKDTYEVFTFTLVFKNLPVEGNEITKKFKAFGKHPDDACTAIQDTSAYRSYCAATTQIGAFAIDNDEWHLLSRPGGDIHKIEVTFLFRTDGHWRNEPHRLSIVSESIKELEDCFRQMKFGYRGIESRGKAFLSDSILRVEVEQPKLLDELVTEDRVEKLATIAAFAGVVYVLNSKEKVEALRAAQQAAAKAGKIVESKKPLDEYLAVSQESLTITAIEVLVGLVAVSLFAAIRFWRKRRILKVSLHL